MRTLVLSSLATYLFAASFAFAAEADAVIPPLSERFQQAEGEEIPDFQKHVSPLLGRLGCNGRSCHGSFQGRGGFRLSLFGYDFKADHEALVKGDKPRVDLQEINASLFLTKPLSDEIHEGGQRYQPNSWEHHVFRRWVAAGAKYTPDSLQKLTKLEITPAELWFVQPGEKVQLKATAVWPDGKREDVTPLCRFLSNNEQVAKVDVGGSVTSSEPGDSHVVVFYDNAVVPVPVIRPVSQLAGDKYPKVETPTKIDELVVAKLRKLGIVPSNLSADAEFLRRVSLDLTGSLPAPAEVEAFLANKSPTKRAEKIEELLASPAYAAWWTTKLCDFTGNNDSQLVGVGGNRGTQDWYDWIYKRVVENEGYDKLCEGFVLATSRRPGQDYYDYCKEMSELYHEKTESKFADRPSMPYYWNRRNLRTTEERAIGFAYTFLGIRIQCAQCHKHPFDQWSKDDFEQFKGFFAGVTASQANRQSDKEAYEKILAELGIDPKLKGNTLDKAIAPLLKQGKIVPFGEVYTVAASKPRADGKKDNNNSRVPSNAKILGEEKSDLTKFADVRQPLMDWLRDPQNPYFARAFVNRAWANYFNVGIVQPPDDLSLANPPSNKALLDYLTQGFIDNKFDMKWVHREICNSRTYQAGWQPNETNAKDERNFSRSVPRRLPAEIAYDAFFAATADDARRENFRTDLKGRGIAVAGASARANNGNGSSFALQVFGRSIRESNCDCDRSSEASLLQTVFMQNDATVLAAVNGGKGTWIDQLSRSWSGIGTSGERTIPAAEVVDREVKRIEIRLEQAKKNDVADQVKRLEDRLAELKAAAKSGKPEKTAGTILSDDQITAVIRQAYLRTLSREPGEDELARCQEFLGEAATPLEGVRGLMWTLINTKEFIVNH